MAKQTDERSIYAYDPLIPPRRHVVSDYEDTFAAMQGTSRVMRMGEPYYCTCVCGAAMITSVSPTLGYWYADHAGCS